MYFLWRGRPAAVLSKTGDWIAKEDVAKRLNEVRLFDNPGEARYIQRTRYSKRGVSVLGEKSFKEKTKIKKLPVCKEAVTATPEKEAETAARMVTYNEYLDIICEGDNGQFDRVVLLPANQDQTTDTPLIQETASLLASLEGYLLQIEKQEQRLNGEIRQLDLLISDRLHQAELLELSDEECASFVKNIHSVQIERRRRKNELTALLTCKELLNQVEPPEIKRAIRDIKNLGKQEYHCRVITETDPFILAHADKIGRRN